MAGGRLIGSNLGNYTVESVIGEGGMGVVYAARHRFLGDRVAIKVLHGNYANNPAIAQRFYQEARSARDIGHPSIIQVLDFGESEEGALYLVMELLEGRSLSQFLAGRRLDEATAAQLIATCTAGLQAAHDKGVIHRDLKPDNIFLVGEQVKILDFGIAKVVTSSANTGTGTMLGTPRYMAPEQARAARLVGPQSDVYSLGVILFEMVTGQVPFDGDLTEVLVKILTEPPPRPSSIAQVSPAMEALILECLAKVPSERPQDMRALRGRLEPWLGNGAPRPSARPLSGQHTTVIASQPRPAPVTTLSRSVGEAVPPPSSAAAGGPPMRGRLAVGGAVALVVGGAAFAMLRPDPPATDVSTGAASAAPAPSPAPPAPPAAQLPPPAPTASPRAAEPAGVAVVVRSEPTGAELLDEHGQVVGATPRAMTVTLPFTYRLRLEGYRPATEVLTEAGEKTTRLERIPARPRPRSETVRSRPLEGLE